MEQILTTTGYLFFLYGAYLFASNYPADPLVKGGILMALGVLLIGIGYLIYRRRIRQMGKERTGWEFR